MVWFQVFTNKGWRVFSEQMREAYLGKISSGRSAPVETDTVKIDFPGEFSPEIASFEIDGLTVLVPAKEISYFESLLKYVDTEQVGNTLCVKLRGRMEGVLLTNQQRWTLLDKMMQKKAGT